MRGKVLKTTFCLLPVILLKQLLLTTHHLYFCNLACPLLLPGVGPRVGGSLEVTAEPALVLNKPCSSSPSATCLFPPPQFL